MTNNTPKERAELTAEKMFDRMYDIYLNLDGIDPIPNDARHMIFTLMQSFAQQEVKKACKARDKWRLDDIILLHWMIDNGYNFNDNKEEVAEFMKETKHHEQPNPFDHLSN